MYLVVQTIEKGKAVLVSVPETWERDGILFWPPKNAIEKLKSENEPEHDWITLQCIVKRRNIPSFAEAEGEIERMIEHPDTDNNMSCVEISDEVPAKKRFKKSKPIFCTTSQPDFNQEASECIENQSPNTTYVKASKKSGLPRATHTDLEMNTSPNWSPRLTLGGKRASPSISGLQSPITTRPHKRPTKIFDDPLSSPGSGMSPTTSYAERRFKVNDEIMTERPVVCETMSSTTTGNSVITSKTCNEPTLPTVVPSITYLTAPGTISNPVEQSATAQNTDTSNTFALGNNTLFDYFVVPSQANNAVEIQNVISAPSAFQQILDGQNLLKQYQESLTKEVCKLTVKLEEFIQTISEQATKNLVESSFKLISQKTDLDDFETKLKDDEYKNKVMSHFSTQCKQNYGKGLNTAYKLVDLIFAREFMKECSWAGGSKSKEKKICFKSYERTIHLFFSLVRIADPTFTLEESEMFLKNIMRNSKKRSLNMNIRQSASKVRPKKKDKKCEKKIEKTSENEKSSSSSSERGNTAIVEERRNENSSNSKVAVTKKEANKNYDNSSTLERDLVAEKNKTTKISGLNRKINKINESEDEKKMDVDSEKKNQKEKKTDDEKETDEDSESKEDSETDSEED